MDAWTLLGKIGRVLPVRGSFPIKICLRISSLNPTN